MGSLISKLKNRRRSVRPLEKVVVMSFEYLFQKTKQLFMAGYQSDELRSEFNRAMKEFTPDDWRKTAACHFSASGLFEEMSYLYLASSHGWEDVVEKLIYFGAPVGHRIQFEGKQPVTAIHVAAGENYLNIIKKLVEACISCSIWDENSNEYIELAYQCRPEIFEYFTTKLNVYTKTRKSGVPDWVSFINPSHRSHDIFCYLFKKGHFRNDLYQEGKWDYLQLMLVMQKITGVYSEQIFLERLPGLLEAGFDLNYEDEEKRTALFWAVSINYLELARCMIESNKVDIVKRSISNQGIYHILMSNKNYTFLSYLIKKGLLTDIDYNNRSPLLSINLWHDYINLGNDPQIMTLILAGAMIIQESMKKNYKTIPVPNCGFLNHSVFLCIYSRDKDLSASYYGLFNEALIENVIHDKRSAIKYALAACFDIMLHPHVCASLLGEFEKILEANWKKEFSDKSLGDALRVEHALQEYVGLPWPVPADTVTREALFTKNGFLEKQCIAFMRERGFSKNFFKMYDVLFDGTFEKIVSNMDLITECNLNPHLLVHGKNIHNIAIIQFVIAWELNMIPNEYEVDGEKFKITLQELFSAMVDPDYSHPISKNYAWTRIFDMRVHTQATFSDPYQMHSHLMVHCRESLPNLSRLMTHSFCKATLRLRDFVNDLTGEKWSTSEVWDRYITVRIPQTVNSHTAQVLTWCQKTGKVPADSTLSVSNPVSQHRFAKL